MIQSEVDVLCVNAQSMLGQQGGNLVDMIFVGDVSAPAFAAKHMALYAQMRAVKDYVISSENLTDEQLFSAQENIVHLVNSCNNYT